MNKLLLIATIVCTLAFATGMPADEEDSWFQGCLQSHNKFRQGEGKPALEQSSQLMSHAQKRVQQLVSGCTFDHSGNRGSGFGENLYAGSGSYGKTCERAVTSWYNEKKYYNKNNPGFSMKTGHYTQVVWRNTRELGCAKGQYDSDCKMRGMTVVVCSYNPPGNYRNQFSDNV